MKLGDFAAFPIQASDAQGSLYADHGLTKREYFAAAALSGMLARHPGTFKEAAECAVMYADALLAALEGKHG